MEDTSKLFTEFTINNLKLANRIVMAPMTRKHSPGGVPNAEVAAYYRRRAEGGCGLIITEGTTVLNEVATTNPDQVPNFHTKEALAGWANVVKEVKTAGGKIMPQLWHEGMMRKADQSPHPELPSIGPSGLLSPEKKVSEPLTFAEIDELIQAYAFSAKSAKEIGFDGVEIHGAHGYLIDQFFWKETNVREDKYGGSISARTRFAVEIIQAIREVVGSDYPIIFRYSQWKQQDFSQKLADTPEELATFLEPLSEAGVDVFHCSTRRYWIPEFEGSKLNLAGWTKKITGKPTITVGSVGLEDDFIHSYAGNSSNISSLDELMNRFNAEEFDLVAVGRAMLVDPSWPNKISESRYSELQPFTKGSIEKYW